MSSIYEDLKILEELLQRGSITQEEYEREKAKLLNQKERPNFGYSGKDLFGLAENTYLMLMHLSVLLGFFFPLLGFVAPVILWYIHKDAHPAVDEHGKQIINALLSYLIYFVVLTITIIGIPIAIVLACLFVLFVIIGAFRANDGAYWKYPFVIQLIK